jgi:hypothetical protein
MGGGDTAGVGDGQGVEEVVDDASSDSGEEMVAATDAATDVDRQAVIASSGMMEDDADSPSSLFGDAAISGSESIDSPTSGGEDFFGSSETTFKDDETTFGDEAMFSDDTSFSTDSNFEQQGDFFGEEDPTATDVFDTGYTSGSILDDEDTGSSILGTLWDIFTGDD